MEQRGSNQLSGKRSEGLVTLEVNSLWIRMDRKPSPITMIIPSGFFSTKWISHSICTLNEMIMIRIRMTYDDEKNPKSKELFAITNLWPLN